LRKDKLVRVESDTVVLANTQYIIWKRIRSLNTPAIKSNSEK